MFLKGIFRRVPLYNKKLRHFNKNAFDKMPSINRHVVVFVSVYVENHSCVA
jgi:hypothetical protein